MPDTKDDNLLREIRDLLKKQQKTLERLEQRHERAGTGHIHWKLLLILTVITLGAGSFGAYQYFKILKSIIDQFPS